jgi:hypothetical protein
MQIPLRDRAVIFEGPGAFEGLPITTATFLGLCGLHAACSDLLTCLARLVPGCSIFPILVTD